MEYIIDMNTKIEKMENFTRIELRHENSICVYIRQNGEWTGYQEVTDDKIIDKGFPRIINFNGLDEEAVWMDMVRSSSAKDLDKVSKIISEEVDLRNTCTV